MLWLICRCEAYYEALMVDPLWEVTPLRALAETASQVALRPLEMCGASAGAFLADFLAPLPLAWKLPALAVCAAALLLLLLMACGYRVRSPLLLLSVEPAARDRGGGEAAVTAQPPPPPREPLPYPTEPNEIRPDMIGTRL